MYMVKQMGESLIDVVNCRRVGSLRPAQAARDDSCDASLRTQPRRASPMSPSSATFEDPERRQDDDSNST